MNTTRTVEIGVGLFGAAGLAALFVLAMKVSNLSAFNATGGYEIVARFENIGGLKVKAPVTAGGVRVGRVAAIGYDSNRYEAVVNLSIDPAFDRLPRDTSASIFTAGLLGEQYVSLEPGGDERFLQQGDEIRITQSALVLERVVGQFLFNKAAEGSSEQ
jgi:phospholipid/cholesterol/gamma-HCH transport system substrate-binding protein